MDGTGEVSLNSASIPECSAAEKTDTRSLQRRCQNASWCPSGTSWKPRHSSTRYPQNKGKVEDRTGPTHIGGKRQPARACFIPHGQETAASAPRKKKQKVCPLKGIKHSSPGPRGTRHMVSRVGHPPKTGVLSEISYMLKAMITNPLPPLRSHNNHSQIYSPWQKMEVFFSWEDDWSAHGQDTQTLPCGDRLIQWSALADLPAEKHVRHRAPCPPYTHCPTNPFC